MIEGSGREGFEMEQGHLSYEIMKAVGKGGSSTVYKGRLVESQKIVAIKQIDLEGMSKEQWSSINEEITMMKGLSHEHIVSYLGTSSIKTSNANKILIFLEYADRGSLRQFYQRRGALREPQVANCTRQILSGLQYLHSNGIAHRDIKCANCLLTRGGIIKLADFGASKRYESESVVSGLKGTPHWMAPEVIRGTQMTTGWRRADVWSVGCTVVEMFTAKLPFSIYDNPMTAMYHIANGEAPRLTIASSPNGTPLEDSPSAELQSFISVCCAAAPEDRPACEALLELPFLTKRSQSQSQSSQHAGGGGLTSQAQAQGQGTGSSMQSPNGKGKGTTPGSDASQCTTPRTLRAEAILSPEPATPATPQPTPQPQARTSSTATHTSESSLHESESESVSAPCSEEDAVFVKASDLEAAAAAADGPKPIVAGVVRVGGVAMTADETQEQGQRQGQGHDRGNDDSRIDTSFGFVEDNEVSHEEGEFTTVTEAAADLDPDADEGGALAVDEDYASDFCDPTDGDERRDEDSDQEADRHDRDQVDESLGKTRKMGAPVLAASQHRAQAGQASSTLALQRPALALAAVNAASFEDAPTPTMTHSRPPCFFSPPGSAASERSASAGSGSTSADSGSAELGPKNYLTALKQSQSASAERAAAIQAALAPLHPGQSSGGSTSTDGSGSGNCSGSFEGHEPVVLNLPHRADIRSRRAAAAAAARASISGPAAAGGDGGGGASSTVNAAAVGVAGAGVGSSGSEGVPGSIFRGGITSQSLDRSEIVGSGGLGVGLEPGPGLGERPKAPLTSAKMRSLHGAIHTSGSGSGSGLDSGFSSQSSTPTPSGEFAALLQQPLQRPTAPGSVFRQRFRSNTDYRQSKSAYASIGGVSSSVAGGAGGGGGGAGGGVHRDGAPKRLSPAHIIAAARGAVSGAGDRGDRGASGPRPSNGDNGIGPGSGSGSTAAAAINSIGSLAPTRAIHSAPAVSRSLSLPPLSSKAGAGGGGAPAPLQSMTPTLKSRHVAPAMLFRDNPAEQESWEK